MHVHSLLDRPELAWTWMGSRGSCSPPLVVVPDVSWCFHRRQFPYVDPKADRKADPHQKNVLETFFLFWGKYKYTD